MGALRRDQTLPTDRDCGISVLNNCLSGVGYVSVSVKRTYPTPTADSGLTYTSFAVS